MDKNRDISNGIIIAPPNIKDYSQNLVDYWIEKIASIANTYSKEKKVGSFFIVPNIEMKDKSVNLFIEWNTEKNISETLLGNTMTIQIADIIEYEQDNIPDIVLDKINTYKKGTK
ncbi:hypothetical protein [Maribacter sp. IgM3_T14_3]|uniref:hypothetical protein n=1 Tax=Maribacter sp. IgM3_T14_3 TaxID=3415140 RepID=UPI003C702885